MPAFNDAGDRLQYRENLVLCCLQDDHVNLLWFLGRYVDSSTDSASSLPHKLPFCPLTGAFLPGVCFTCINP